MKENNEWIKVLCQQPMAAFGFEICRRSNQLQQTLGFRVYQSVALNLFDTLRIIFCKQNNSCQMLASQLATLDEINPVPQQYVPVNSGALISSLHKIPFFIFIKHCARIFILKSKTLIQFINAMLMVFESDPDSLALLITRTF